MLKNIFYLSFVVAFAAIAIPSRYGGMMTSLRIDGSKFYLWDHGISTEVTPQTMVGLLLLSGIGASAALICLISGGFLLWKKVTERARRPGSPARW